MTVPSTLYKRVSVDDPTGRQWTIVVDDRLDPTMARLARESAERYGRYAMTIVAPDGRSAEVLKDANVVQVDRELDRFRSAITAGDWGVELTPLAVAPAMPAEPPA